MVNKKIKNKKSEDGNNININIYLLRRRYKKKWNI